MMKSEKGAPTLPRPMLETVIGYRDCVGCSHHRAEGSGCRVVDDPQVPRSAFLEREPCFLRGKMLAFARRYLVHRPQHSMEAEDLVQEATLRLLRTSDAAPEQPGLRPFLAYLQRTIFHCAVSAERQLLGRMRCGNCKHYGLFSRQCLASQHSWTAKGLAADQDPRQLDPPCDRFITARSPREIESAPEPKQPEPRENPAAEQLYRALVELAAVQPRAALVLRARLLDGRPYADLEELGASTRTLKRDYRTGLEFLRRRLATD